MSSLTGTVERRALRLPVGEQLVDSARVSMMAPDRMWAPGSEPFSSTTTETSRSCSAASCFRRMAVGQAGGARTHDHDHVVLHGFARAELGEDLFLCHGSGGS
jgi:hypothetical protein